VLVKVHAASLNPLDWKIRAGHVRLVPLFARPPRTLGTDLAGEIVGVGGGPGPRHRGERVFGSLSPFGRDGSCAEYAVIGTDRIVEIPPGVDYESAATLPVAGGTALQAPWTKPTCNRASALVAGRRGHFAVQLPASRRRGRRHLRHGQRLSLISRRGPRPPASR
jgi:NADPH:quinone reductase-like Zn-dependent oxidoreductase